MSTTAGRFAPTGQRIPALSTPGNWNACLGFGANIRRSPAQAMLDQDSLDTVWAVPV
jgi:hypothetical protein